VIEKLNLQTKTADEIALHQLSERSKEFVPALASLRSKAVDRDILLSKVSGSCEQSADASDGESSQDEFFLSSGDEVMPDTPPLVLPEGWSVQRVTLNGRECRQFVDPSGNHYRTEAQALQAVSEFRRRENIAKSVRARIELKRQARSGLTGDGQENLSLDWKENGTSSERVAEPEMPQLSMENNVSTLVADKVFALIAASQEARMKADPVNKRCKFA
jgi:hypothetical protein